MHIMGEIMTDVQRRLDWALLYVLGFIWGSNFIFMKMAIAVIPPLEVAWMRTIFGAAPIALFALAKGALTMGHLRYIPHFAVMAMLANVVPYVGLVIGTQHLASGVTGAISGSIPFITAVMVAFAVPTEPLSRSKIAGLLIGFVGILLVSPIGNNSSSAEGSPLTGVAAVLAGAVGYAAALIYARRFLTPLSLNPLSLAVWQMIVASILLAPLAAPGHWAALWQHAEAAMGLVLGLGLLGTGIGFVIYYRLINSLGALKAGSVYYLPPIVALIIGHFFGGENVSILQLLGAGLIMCGIYYANRK